MVASSFEGMEELVGANGGLQSESLDKLKKLVMNVQEQCLKAQQAILELLKRVDEESRSVMDALKFIIDATTEKPSYVELLLGSEWARVEVEAEDEVEGKASIE